MKKLLLKSLLPALLMILCGFGSAKAETFLVNGNATDMPTSPADTPTTVSQDGVSYTVVQAKSTDSNDATATDQLHGGTSGGKTILFTKNKGWITNTTKFSSITKIRVKSGRECSTSANFGIALSTEPFTSKPTSSDFAFTGTTSNKNNVYPFEVTTPANYIAIVSTNDKNLQLSIEITGTLDTSGPTLPDSEIAWPVASFSYTIGETSESELPVLANPNNVSVTYASSNTSVADFEDGTLVIKESGTTTISAGVNDPAYTPSTVSYTLYVLDPIKDGVFEFTGTRDYGSGITPTNYADYYETTPSTWTAVNVKLVVDGKYRWWSSTTGNSLRTYKPSSTEEAGTLTFSVPEGKVITKIQFDAKVYYNANTGEFDSTGKIWTGAANTVILTNNNSNNTTIKTITVTYVSPVELTVSDVKYSTLYYSDRALVVPTGLAAYTFAYNAVKNEVTAAATYAAGDVIPARVAVVLYGNAGDYTFALADEAGTAPDENILKGTDETKEETAEGTPYVLSVYDNTVGFYWAAADGGQTFTNKAHKAYLDLPTSANGAPAKIILDFGNTDGINCIVVDQDEAEGSMYNVLGQPVNNNYRGFVIRNGKKAINK